jgi:hypothetical protein
MLAPEGVEALHGTCMPHHDRGRIRAEALHAQHNREDAPYQPLTRTDSTVTALSEMVSVGALKGDAYLADVRAITGKKLMD